MGDVLTIFGSKTPLPELKIFNTHHVSLNLIFTSNNSRYDAELSRVVENLVEAVRIEGDEAIFRSALQFDSPLVTTLASASCGAEGLSPDLVEALSLAHSRVLSFHQQQSRSIFGGLKDGKWSMPGSHVGQRFRALNRVGVYVPGGRAFYPSSVIMNVTPAAVAGVSEIFVASPASQTGDHDPILTFAFGLCGAKGGFKMGGASAVAAFAFGTETVPKVDKIVGPGNKWVNEAKRQLWGQVGLDGYAGASEVCVVIDASSNAAYAAADFVTQIEHAPDNAGTLISTDDGKLFEVLSAMATQIENEPRSAIIRQALREQSRAILVRDREEAIEAINLCAPEHLSLAVENPEEMFDRVENAGSVFMGEWTPESAGDYVIGPSHTLPTHGAARWQSPVNLLDFFKIQSFANLSKKELSDLIPAIEQIALAEGFPGHGFGASIRRPL